MPRNFEIAALTTLAMMAFASNSVLTRLALASHSIDAATFSLVRITAGALMLTVLSRIRRDDPNDRRTPGVGGPLTLFCYVAPFSFAYVRIGAGLGALVLFGTVQVAMISWGILRGERPTSRAWLGLVLAVAGLAALTIPSASRPDLLGVALMVLAGVSWASYSLQGKTAGDPLLANAFSFRWSVSPALILSAVTFRQASATTSGLALAVLSGAVTSALGYAVWYRALRGLSATRAAAVQLSVPVIAAVAAVTLLGETPKVRIVVAGIAILGGVALVLIERPPRSAVPRAP